MDESNSSTARTSKSTDGKNKKFAKAVSYEDQSNKKRHKNQGRQDLKLLHTEQKYFTTLNFGQKSQ